MYSALITVIPGDGIGKEVCQAAVDVVKASVRGLTELDFAYFDGGAECYRNSGFAFPKTTQEACLKADAVLHGAIGLPEVMYSDGTEIGQSFSMQARRLMDLYANIRPIRWHKNIQSALRLDVPIDYVIVRENTEGLYAAHGGGNIIRDQVATDTLIMTRTGIERITRKAAQICMSRNGAPADGKHRVTIVDKANVLRSYAFFRKVALEVLEDYPQIEAECQMVDAMTAHMIERPDTFDVVVTENIFGDIISDLGAATIGGLGVAPSAELGDQYGYFQGIHGSAPDIAGKGIANPYATIVSAAMMLDWLAETKNLPELRQAAGRIHKAVDHCLQNTVGLTADLGGSASTQQSTDLLIEQMEAY